MLWVKVAVVEAFPYLGCQIAPDAMGSSREINRRIGLAWGYVSAGASSVAFEVLVAIFQLWNLVDETEPRFCQRVRTDRKWTLDLAKEDALPTLL